MYINENCEIQTVYISENHELEISDLKCTLFHGTRALHCCYDPTVNNVLKLNPTQDYLPVVITTHRSRRNITHHTLGNTTAPRRRSIFHPRHTHLTLAECLIQ